MPLLLCGVKDHVIALPREHALDELGKTAPTEQQTRHAQQKQQRLLFRLAPGRNNSAKAIRGRNGKILTLNGRMAAARLGARC